MEMWQSVVKEMYEKTVHVIVFTVEQLTYPIDFVTSCFCPIYLHIGKHVKYHRVIGYFSI